MNDSTNKIIFAKNLSKFVDESGKSRKQICQDLNISYTTFCDWINANKYPRIDKIELLAQYFKIEKSDLIEDKKSISTEKHNLKIEPFDAKKMVPVPVVGRVAAGYNCFANTDIQGYELVNSESIIDGYDYIWLKVIGDSMEPMLLEDDLVLVRLQSTVDDEDYAVVIVDDEDGLVKQVRIEQNQIVLLSVNPYYPPRIFKNKETQRVRFVGKVIESKRKF